MGSSLSATCCRSPHRPTTAMSPSASIPPGCRLHVPAPNMPWVSDFTDVATWTGFVSVAFVIDAYARRIVGWRASRTAHASFVLDGLEQALHDRRPKPRNATLL